jgi:hypothetical protein
MLKLTQNLEFDRLTNLKRGDMHIILVAFFIGVAWLGGCFPLKDQPQGQMSVTVDAPGRAVTMKQDVKPLSAFKFDKVVKQMYDYSCGSAALATLLNGYLGENLSERQVIMGMFRYGDKEQIEKRRAFSALDMKKFAAALGYKGVGYRAEIDDLRTLAMPCIVPLEILGYQHFVVFRGIHEDHVFLADPAQGNISFDISEFKDRWYNNIAFVIYRKEGEKEINALKLTEEDLRFIDLNTTGKMLLFGERLPSAAAVERELRELTGERMYYKLK